MVDSKRYWFAQSPNSYKASPVTWQGWCCLFAVCALEIVVTRELQGAARAIAALAVAFGFLLLARSKTRIVSRDP
jgi:hypothetical protein